jgi:hypothetical protein
MTRVRSTAEISIYEVNDEKVPVGKDLPQLKLLSHWNDEDQVVIVWNGKRLTVIAHDLLDAVRRVSR